MQELDTFQAVRSIGCGPREVAATVGDPRPCQRRSACVFGAVLLAVGAALLSSGAGARGMVFACLGGILMLAGTAVAATDSSPGRSR